jgi:DNA/RNA-binding domain of Phe-tRNA-synthetase-like protein
MSEPLGLSPAAGFIEPRVAAEFPGLRLDWITAAARPRDSPPSLVRRLKDLSNRYRGAAVVTMRTKPIPQAFRAFFRQIGLDPDVTRIPSEHAAVLRLLHGEFRSSSLTADACLIALIETGVPVWALDADAVDPDGLGIRTATEASGDLAPAGERGPRLSAGSLVVADRRIVHAQLFGEPAAGTGVGPRTARVALYSVGVDGVPAIHVEEALWMCAELLR